MKKGQVYEGVIEKVQFPNKGQVRVGDRIVTVKKRSAGAEGKVSGEQNTEG